MFRDDAQVHLSEPSYWGVTFGADSNRFYATVRSDEKTYLVEGDVAKGEVRLLRETSRTLRSRRTRPGSPSRSWSTQTVPPGACRYSIWRRPSKPRSRKPAALTTSAEWLDNGHVLYAVGQDLWTVPSDGTGSPGLFLRHGLSPAVVH